MTANPLTITHTINLKFTCPSNMGIPPVTVAELYVCEQTAADEVNAENAVDANGAMHPRLTLFGSKTDGIAANAAVNWTVSKSLVLASRYFICLVAKQGNTYYQWHATVYDLELNADAGVLPLESDSTAV
jgi:hypothetical protein